MIIGIKKSRIKGEIAAPASKSVMIRAIAAAALSDGVSRIYNPTYCEDAIAAIQVAECLGAMIIKRDGHLELTGNFRFKSKEINCGESGLTARMFIPIVTLLSEEITVNGERGLLQRPLPGVSNVLRQLGVECEDNEGYLPIILKGPLGSGILQVDGSQSSQFISGLMYSLPKCIGDSSLELINPKSKPYIDLTIDILSKFGIIIDETETDKYQIRGSQCYKAQELEIEGDWSGAAFLLAAGVIAGEIKVNKLNPESKQADKKILELIQQNGGEISHENDSFCVKSKNLKAFHFDAEHCPDLIPVAVALAANCNGTSEIIGANRLIHKESNRAEALRSEFSKMGIEVAIDGNKMKVTGGKIRSAVCNSHNDHRIAMAIAIAALNSDEEIKIIDAECVAKSYPNFFGDLKKIGAEIV
jgi:3-phosphoshikimate 1-carboxyvinyltransferase